MLFLRMGQPRSFGSKASLLFLLLFANRPQSIHTCIANRFSAHYRLIISHHPSQIHPTIEANDKRTSLVLSRSGLHLEQMPQRLRFCSSCRIVSVRKGAFPHLKPYPHRARRFFPLSNKKEVILLNDFMESGGDLLSRAVTSQVPSALKGLTSVFGMGTGGTPSPLPPEIVALFDYRAFTTAHEEKTHYSSFKPSSQSRFF